MNAPRDKKAFAPRDYKSDSFHLLKASVRLALLDPLDEKQKVLAHAINDLFSLLETRDYQLAKAEEAVSHARAEERESWIKEVTPYLEDLFNQTSCQCGYFGEVDEDGEALHSMCSECALKDLAGLTNCKNARSGK